MSSHSLPDACLPALIQCLERLTHGLLVLPAGISDSSPAQALPGLIGALQAGGKLSLPSSESGLTLNEALALGGISLDLLATLRLAGASSPVIGETDQGLTNALERLSADIGAAVRQEIADRVRGLSACASTSRRGNTLRSRP